MAEIIVPRTQNSFRESSCFESAEFIAPNSLSKLEELPMSIADDGIGFILDLLSDLSVDCGAYALREAYSNAYDATMASGDMTRPIEIFLPADLTDSSLRVVLGENRKMSTLVVRDHGIGMSCDDVRRYFTQYGGSKKRAMNDKEAVGSKGLGSKAPLACSDTFTVVSVKDGIKTTAIIERRENQNFATLESEKTDQPSGTEVTIPVSNPVVAEQMRACAIKLAKWNLDANLLIDGEPVSSFLMSDDSPFAYLGEQKIGVDENGNDIKFRMWQRGTFLGKIREQYLRATLIIGGFPYLLSGKSGIIENEIIIAGDPGYLNFPPSRDEIKDDDAKKNFFDAVGHSLTNIDFGFAITSWMSRLNNVLSIGSWMNSLYYTMSMRDYRDAVIKSPAPRRYLRLDNSFKEEYVFPADSVEVNGMSLAPLFKKDEKEFPNKFISCLFTENGTKNGMFRLLGANGFLPCKKKELADNIGDKDVFSPLCDVWLNYANVIEFDTAVSRGKAFFQKTDKNEDISIVVIKGAMKNGKFNQFALLEKSIREFYAPKAKRVFYLFADEKFEALTKYEKLFFKGYNLSIVSFNEMIEQAKQHKNSKRMKTAQENIPSDLANLHVKAYLLKNDYPKTALFNGAPTRGVIDCKISFTDESVVEETLVVLGKFCRSAKMKISQAASVLKSFGHLDGIAQIVFLSEKDVSASSVNQMRGMGVRFFLDARTLKNLVPDTFVDTHDVVDVKIEKVAGCSELNADIVLQAKDLFAKDMGILEENISSLIASESLPIQLEKQTRKEQIKYAIKCLSEETWNGTTLAKTIEHVQNAELLEFNVTISMKGTAYETEQENYNKETAELAAFLNEHGLNPTVTRFLQYNGDKLSGILEIGLSAAIKEEFAC